MSRRRAWCACLVAVALALCLPVAAQQGRGDSLDAARSLFAGAAYEDALGMLERLDDAPRLPKETERDINALRAMCLLALGRDDDAREAMATVVDVDPRFTYAEADVAPRIRSMFLALRTERLPDVVRSRYAAARDAFAAEDYATAAATFKDVVALLDDPVLAGGPSATVFEDLKTLASGFYDLSVKQSNLAGARALPSSTTPDVPTPATVSPAAAPPVSPARSTASNADGNAASGDVKPPVPVDQRLPALMRLLTESDKPYRASVRILVDETGRVTSASLITSSTPTYDRLVVDSVKTWRYRPATRNGVAIPYARTVEVVVAPATP